MSKCLITKLSGTVSNSDILRLNETRIKFVKVDNPTDATRGIGLRADKPVTLEIVGDGYFTDKTLSQNLGKTMTIDSDNWSVFVSNTDTDVAILDKRSLTHILQYYRGQTTSLTSEGKKIALENLKYCTNLKELNFPGSTVTGSLDSLKYLTNLTLLSVRGSDVTGSLDSLKNLTKLTSLELQTDLPTGDLSSLAGMNNLRNLLLKKCKITGDIATLPANVAFFSTSYSDNAKVTWGTRPTTSTIMGLEVAISNIDEMLQNQAQCKIGYKSGDSTWFKVISCTGTRTSASDDAVATLQSKGYTVSIAKA